MSPRYIRVRGHLYRRVEAARRPRDLRPGPTELVLKLVEEFEPKLDYEACLAAVSTALQQAGLEGSVQDIWEDSPVQASVLYRFSTPQERDLAAETMRYSLPLLPETVGRSVSVPAA